MKHLTRLMTTLIKHGHGEALLTLGLTLTLWLA